ncbi:uncharacterized protein LOC144449464 [Glandiceps talaboti]
MPTDRLITRFSTVPYSFRRQETDSAFTTQQFTRERFRRCKGLYRKDLTGHYGCVNAIEFSNNGGELLVSGGDDRRVLVWNIEKTLSDFGDPAIMKGEHDSNIFCLAFSSTNSKIFSSGNDEKVIVHDTQSRETLDVFLHEDTVYGLAVDPFNDNVFASACDDGRVLIWDIRERSGQEPFVLANYTSAFHAVMFNPVEPRLLATANSKEGVGLWDIRAPRSCLMRYGGSMSQQSAMSVKFNSSGDRLVALRRRLPPVLYDITNAVPLLQFDHSGYYNSCTMKSCCFGGDRDQYVLSGSDDFNLYVWRIPDETLEVPWVSEAQMVLKGHRSIVNQVRFNPDTHLVASSGVEKVIKIWSPFKLPGGKGNISGSPDPEELERNMYSHEEYIDLVLNSGQGLSHDYTNHSTSEDPRMIAFFDSLVQREVEGWSSLSDSDDSLLSAEGFYYMQLMERDLSSSASESLVSSESDSDGSWHPLRFEINSDENSDTVAESRQLFDLDGQQHNQSQTNESTERSRLLAAQQASTERTVREGLHSLTSALRRTRTLSVPETRDTSSDSDQDSNHTTSKSVPSSSPRNQRQTRRRRWLHSDSDSNSSSRLLSSGPHLEHDSLISLRQRIACRRALREKMARRNSQRSQQNDDTSDEGDEDTQAKLQIVTSQRSAISSDRRSIRLLRRRIYDEEGDGNEVTNEDMPSGSGINENSTPHRDGGGESSDNNFDNFVSVATHLLKRTSPSNEDSNHSPPPCHHKKQKVDEDCVQSNDRTKVTADSKHRSPPTCKTESNVTKSTSNGEVDLTSLSKESHNSATNSTTTNSTTNSLNPSSSSTCSITPSDAVHSDAANGYSNGDVAATSTTNGTSTTNDGNWRDFCRFKNRLARSRRNYRKNSESKEDVPDSDE